MILLDTHVLVWMDADLAELGPRSRAAIRRAWKTEQVAVSAISFWECAMLQRRGRLDLRSDTQQWRAELMRAGLIEIALDGSIGTMGAELAWQHKDPADRIIVATALIHDATLFTADTAMLRWKSKIKRRDARK